LRAALVTGCFAFLLRAKEIGTLPHESLAQRVTTQTEDRTMTIVIAATYTAIAAVGIVGLLFHIAEQAGF